MRTLIASALVLLPVLAHGQASTSTAVKAQALQAKVVAPAPLAAAAAAAKAPAAAPAPAADSLLIPVNETVVKDDSFTFDASTPRLLHSTPIVLTLADMRSQADDATVVVHAIVGKDGIPTNLSIERSAGAALDRRALEAVAKYRFAAAMKNGAAVEAPVDIRIEVKKS